MKALGKLFDDIVSIVYTNRQGYNMTYCSIFCKLILISCWDSQGSIPFDLCWASLIGASQK
jgi:hypothetical protein